MPYRTIPVPYIPCHTMPYHAIPCHTMPCLSFMHDPNIPCLIPDLSVDIRNLQRGAHIQICSDWRDLCRPYTTSPERNLFIHLDHSLSREGRFQATSGRLCGSATVLTYQSLNKYGILSSRVSWRPLCPTIVLRAPQEHAAVTKPLHCWLNSRAFHGHGGTPEMDGW